MKELYAEYIGKPGVYLGLLDIALLAFHSKSDVAILYYGSENQNPRRLVDLLSAFLEQSDCDNVESCLCLPDAGQCTTWGPLVHDCMQGRLATCYTSERMQPLGPCLPQGWHEWGQVEPAQSYFRSPASCGNRTYSQRIGQACSKFLNN